MPVSLFRRWMLAAVLSVVPAVPHVASAQSPVVPAPSGEYEKALAALNEHLCDGNILEAVSAAQDARKLRPGACEPQQALRAIYDALGPATGAERLQVDAACPGEPEDTAVSPQGAPPKPSQERFVIVSRLQARRTPEPGAPVVAELPINARVRVVVMRGDWAGIMLEARLVTGPAPRTGYVLARYLASAPLSKASLLADVKRLKTEGKAREALFSLRRAAALDLTDVPLQRELACDAARLGRYPIALSAIAARPPLGGLPR
jgi:hypothetical protein